jgi:hypothetical protein
MPLRARLTCARRGAHGVSDYPHMEPAAAAPRVDVQGHRAAFRFRAGPTCAHTGRAVTIARSEHLGNLPGARDSGLVRDERDSARERSSGPSTVMAGAEQHGSSTAQ